MPMFSPPPPGRVLFIPGGSPEPATGVGAKRVSAEWNGRVGMGPSACRTARGDRGYIRLKYSMLISGMHRRICKKDRTINEYL